MDFNIDDLNSISEDKIRDMFDGIDFTENIPDDENKKPKKRDISCETCDTKEFIVEDTSNGFMVCTKCGQVLDGVMDFGPERHNYENDTTQDARTSMAVSKLLPTSSLGTQISGGNWKSHMRRLHEWNIMPYKERSLSYVFKELGEKCKKANLLKCIEDDAKIMYKTISECKHAKGKNMGKNIIIRGVNRKSLIAACIFFACRRKNMTRSPREIAELFDIKYTDMTKGCKNFLKLINIKQKGMNIGTSQPDDFVLRFCKDLKIKQEYVDQAMTISKNIKKLSISTDHNPYSIAIASILLMAEINKIHTITKKQLGITFGVSEVTITKTFKKIEKYKNVLVDNNLTDKMISNKNTQTTEITISDKLMERFKKYNIDPSTMGGGKVIVQEVKEEIKSSYDEEYEEDEEDESELSDIESDKEEIELEKEEPLENELDKLYHEIDDINVKYNNLVKNSPFNKN
jgi:transcription initiation factor TFIIB